MIMIRGNYNEKKIEIKDRNKSVTFIAAMFVFWFDEFWWSLAFRLKRY